ncbi:non-classical arabinogalactan protein 31 [Solenopsis invicta]|uniref:non-classical arabinogalactan protein 31 n=1 Tax=Solenopsis invicta TaxID=13686 RepID=UPI00193D93FA|nr:non-classical arabinogalactan protein 31 [Solenopsis invicta]
MAPPGEGGTSPGPGRVYKEHSAGRQTAESSLQTWKHWTHYSPHRPTTPSSSCCGNKQWPQQQGKRICSPQRDWRPTPPAISEQLAQGHPGHAPTARTTMPNNRSRVDDSRPPAEFDDRTVKEATEGADDSRPWPQPHPREHRPDHPPPRQSLLEVLPPPPKQPNRRQAHDRTKVKTRPTLAPKQPDGPVIPPIVPEKTRDKLRDLFGDLSDLDETPGSIKRPNATAAASPDQKGTATRKTPASTTTTTAPATAPQTVATDATALPPPPAAIKETTATNRPTHLPVVVPIRDDITISVPYHAAHITRKYKARIRGMRYTLRFGHDGQCHYVREFPA